jgi:predicted ATPase
MITQLNVRAFKGLREFSIAPRRVNLLIGANGTGKTNFADLIAFIASLCPRGLSATIETFGGLAQVRTRQPGAGTPYKLQIEIHLGKDQSRGIQQATYHFALAQSREIKVQREILDAVVYKRKPGKPAKQGFPRFDTGQPIPLRYQREGLKMTEWSEGLGPRISEFDDEQELVLASYGRLGELRTLSDYLGSWRVYNIDATIAKQSTGGSDVELERYGANIVPFVARMLRDKRTGGRLLDDLREAVPYVQNIEPDRVLTFQTLRFSEQDTGVEFQLSEMSDGTIRLLGLLSVLRQPAPPAVVVIEEPENAMHAYAIHHFLEVSRRTAMGDQFASQVFLTSHSPAVVDEVLSLEAMRETNSQTACFVTQRRPSAPAIVPAPESVMKAIAQNLGRPSDFQREGSFGDEPAQLELPLTSSEEEA